MKKIWLADAVFFTALSVFCFVMRIIIENDGESEIFLMNVSAGCGLKAAGVWADILSESKHTHLEIRLKVSIVAAAVLFICAVSHTELGILLVVSSYFGVITVLIFDLILFVLFRSALFIKEKLVD